VVRHEQISRRGCLRRAAVNWAEVTEKLCISRVSAISLPWQGGCYIGLMSGTKK
jgi:hypothetical protein